MHRGRGDDVSAVLDVHTGEVRQVRPVTKQLGRPLRSAEVVVIAAASRADPSSHRQLAVLGLQPAKAFLPAVPRVDVENNDAGRLAGQDRDPPLGVSGPPRADHISVGGRIVLPMRRRGPLSARHDRQDGQPPRRVRKGGVQVGLSDHRAASVAGARLMSGTTVFRLRNSSIASRR